MATHWQLKELLEAQDIENAAELHRALKKELGLRVSQQSLSKLLRKPPESLKMQTAQMFCTFLQVPLSDFLVITPEPKIRSANIIQPYRTEIHKTDTLFVDPTGFL
jgi:hypothetical protein